MSFWDPKWANVVSYPRSRAHYNTGTKISTCILSPWDQGSLKHISTSCCGSPNQYVTCSLKKEPLCCPWEQQTHSRPNTFGPVWTTFLPISHSQLIAPRKSWPRGHPTNQNAVTGKWDDNLLFLLLITSSPLSLCQSLPLPVHGCRLMSSFLNLLSKSPSLHLPLITMLFSYTKCS